MLELGKKGNQRPYFFCYKEARVFAKKAAEQNGVFSRIVRKDEVYIVEYSIDFDIADILICGNPFSENKLEPAEKAETKYQPNSKFISKLRHAGRVPVVLNNLTKKSDQWRTCILCHGDGGFAGNCPRCGGSGWESDGQLD